MLWLNSRTKVSLRHTGTQAPRCAGSLVCCRFSFTDANLASTANQKMREVETFRRPLEGRQCPLSYAIKVVETELRVHRETYFPIILKPCPGSAPRVADAAVKPALMGRVLD